MAARPQSQEETELKTGFEPAAFAMARRRSCQTELFQPKVGIGRLELPAVRLQSERASRLCPRLRPEWAISELN